jgi:hypothetical protein
MACDKHVFTLVILHVNAFKHFTSMVLFCLGMSEFLTVNPNSVTNYVIFTLPNTASIIYLKENKLKN